MAIIRFGGGVTDARGSVGGTTFSKSRAGATMRARVTGVNARSKNQTLVRERLAGLSKLWSSGLSDSDRASWRSFALVNPVTNVFGDTIYLSGYNMFTRLNSTILNTGNSIITTPPASLAVTNVTDVTLTVADTTPWNISVAITPSSLGTNEEYYIFATRPMNQGINFVRSQLLYIINDPGTAGAVVFSDEYLAKMGFRVFQTNQRVFALVAVVNTTTGAVSPGFLTSALAS